MAKSTKRIVLGSAERLSATLIEGFRDFPQLYGKCQGMRCKVGARPALPPTPPQGAADSPKRLKNVAYLQCVTEPV